MESFWAVKTSLLAIRFDGPTNFENFRSFRSGQLSNLENLRAMETTGRTYMLQELGPMSEERKYLLQKSCYMLEERGYMV